MLLLNPPLLHSTLGSVRNPPIRHNFVGDFGGFVGDFWGDFGFGGLVGDLGGGCR